MAPSHGCWRSLCSCFPQTDGSKGQQEGGNSLFANLVLGVTVDVCLPLVTQSPGGDSPGA